jgi:hypothetical protein
VPDLKEQLVDSARRHAAAAIPDFRDVVRRRLRRDRRNMTAAVAAVVCVLGAAAVVVSQASGRQAQEQLRPAGPAPTVLFDLAYVGVGLERANAREGLQRCLQQPGTAVTRRGSGDPPIEQVSVTGDRDAVRRFEGCLRLVLNTRIDRVPQQADGTQAVDPSRSLADRYNAPPVWPGDPWTKYGREVPQDELVLAAGPEHCGWQESTYIGGKALSKPRARLGAYWVRDPKGVLDFEPRLQAEFRPRAALPADAVWTGYAQDGVELWVAPSDSADYVYLVNVADRRDVERWVRGGGLCA